MRTKYKLPEVDQAIKDLRYIVASGQYKQGRLTAIVNRIAKLEAIKTKMSSLFDIWRGLTSTNN